MKCERCEGNKTRVLDTRDYGVVIQRLRICRNCGYEFITVEKMDVPRVESGREPMKAQSEVGVEVHG